MREIPLSQNQVALIDDEDYELSRPYTWYAVYKGGHWYAATKIPHPDGGWYISPNGKRQRRQTTLYLHQLIMGVKNVDHRDPESTLDDRRCNLRVATVSQNNANRRIPSNNTSGYKGVSWHAQSGRWQTYIRKDGRKKHLGLFDNAVDAAFAYDSAAYENFGDFAQPNFQFAPDNTMPRVWEETPAH